MAGLSLEERIEEEEVRQAMPEPRNVVVGIDLGTTNSLVAYLEGDTPVVIPGEDGERPVPAVVAWTDEGVAVGNAARGTLMSDSAAAV